MLDEASVVIGRLPSSRDPPRRIAAGPVHGEPASPGHDASRTGGIARDCPRDGGTIACKMLYGRDAERARIAGLLDGARASRSGVLVLRGEAGAGKSALLQRRASRPTGMQVLRGGGIESEAQLPFAALHQLVRPILGDIDRLPDPQAGRAAPGAGTRGRRGR